jgi:hypothetical protein
MEVYGRRYEVIKPSKIHQRKLIETLLKTTRNAKASQAVQKAHFRSTARPVIGTNVLVSPTWEYPNPKNVLLIQAS